MNMDCLIQCQLLLILVLGYLLNLKYGMDENCRIEYTVNYTAVLYSLLTPQHHNLSTAQSAVNQRCSFTVHRIAAMYGERQ